jgi:hypothetical protein
MAGIARFRNWGQAVIAQEVRSRTIGTIAKLSRPPAFLAPAEWHI